MHSMLASGRSAAAAQQVKSQCAGLQLGSRQIRAPSQAPHLHAIRHHQLRLASGRVGCHFCSLPGVWSSAAGTSFQRLHVQHDTCISHSMFLDSYACLRCVYREPPAYKYCLLWSRVRRQHARTARPTAESSGASSSAVGAAGSDTPKVPKTAFFDGLERPIGATGQEWHPLLALAIFALGYFNHLTLNSMTLFKAFAIFQVASSAVAILFNEVRFDKMSSVVCPAVLAMGVVQPGVDPGNVTLGILGTYLSYEQQVVPFWPMTLSLFAALYRGLGNEWITVAYCLLSINGLWNAREADPGFKEHKANLLTLPVLAVSAFVATRGLIPLWTTSLGLGEVARSTYALLHRLWHEHT